MNFIMAAAFVTFTALLSTVIGSVKTTRTMDATASIHDSDDFHKKFPQTPRLRVSLGKRVSEAIDMPHQALMLRVMQNHGKFIIAARNYFQLSSLFDVLLRDRLR